MSERQLLILGPATEPKGVEDAYAVTAGCGHQCWLSPGSQVAFMSENTDSKCVACFGGEEAMKEAIKSGKGKPADAGELVREFRKWLKERDE